MRLGIPTESWPGERRVAATPETTKKLRELGFEVCVQSGAGSEASFPDAAYAAAGAELVPDAAAVLGGCDVVLKVRAPSPAEIDALREGTTLISFLWPKQNPALVEQLAARKVSALAMDAVPRISRAQKMDALSSMANLVGYRAVIEAASRYGSFFTGQITAAGKVPPAKVLVIGAGVAGLAAIGAARGLGAVVRAFDTRAAVKEQVQSLGADFLTVELEESGEGQGGYAREMSPAFIAAEMALFARQAREVDIVITTALIPGRPAPKLWETSAVEAMKPGSVVIDLAAEQGGNCELTRVNEVVVHHGVQVVGFTDYPSRLATTASQLYGTNLVHLLTDMGGGRAFKIDLEDEAVRGATIVLRGEVLPPPPPVNPSPAAPKAAATPSAAPTPTAAPAPAPKVEHGKAGHGGPARPQKPMNRPLVGALSLAAVAGWLYLMLAVKGEATAQSQAFVQHLTVFVLACFVGWQVIWGVAPALHTPLMSVTNAISGIIILGGMLQAHGSGFNAATGLGIAAVLLATINIAGGFLVTQRMLRMFRK